MYRLLTILIVFFALASCGQTPTIENKSTGLFPIKEYGKWGYINSNGKTVIKCQFDLASQFLEGLAPIQQNGLWGFIDTTGKIVIAPKYQSVSGFSDGLCYVQIQKGKKNENAFIKKDGSVSFISTYEDIGFFYSGRAKVKINNEICFIDKKGKVVINTHFPYGSASQFHEGIALVWTGDSCKYIDTTGKIIAAFPSMGNDDFSEGLARVRINEKNAYIDKFGKPVITSLNDNYTYFEFSDGMAEVVVPGEHKSGFIDTTGKIVIPLKYRSVNHFREGLAPFQDGKHNWGFLNNKGDTIISAQFDNVDGWNGFKNGLCWVHQNHQWGYINKKGEFVWKEQNDIEYAKLDKNKWKLDTLEIDKPLYAGKYASGDNYPRKQNFKSLNKLTLRVDTTDLTVFEDKYVANKIYLINASKDTIKILAQDGQIKIIQQAINKKGKWQDIENFFNSWCGNSYHYLSLKPNEYQIFSAPIFKGKIKTQLRFKLVLGDKEIYSNSYIGQINKGQFLKEKDKDKTGIIVSSSSPN